jgi:two-component system response regulator HydG
MPLAMQAKLLRVLESGEIVRVGSNEPRHVNVRLVSATNHDLEKLIDEGKFRQDLYYRIRGAHIHLPALCDRREDIAVLVRHFLDLFAHRMNKGPMVLDEQAMLVLVQYAWPGNVRQLMNVAQNLVLEAEDQHIEMHHLPLELRQSALGETDSPNLGSLTGLSLDQIEKHAIRNALRLAAGNREHAAKMLGIGERTLYRKLKEYGVK